jgi:NAD(P)-dependent dehydrogenase (short-subunit alcohol dehydrogenase family)
VVSPIRIANTLLPAMRARGWGRIIVVGSTGMQQPIPNLALSNTLRTSIWAWLKTMSGEVAKDGVTMNVLAPGTIHTDRTNESAAATARRRNIGFEEALAERLSEAAAHRPLSRGRDNRRSVLYIGQIRAFRSFGPAFLTCGAGPGRRETARHQRGKYT